jgi:hypothetical protein
MRIPSALAVALVSGTALIAQAPAPNAPAAAPQALVETDAREVRQQLQAILSKYPPEVGRILKMDPTMLANQQYLAQYQALQLFLAAHPEVSRHPAFYLDFVRQAFDYTLPDDPDSRARQMWMGVFEGVGVFAIVVFISGMLAWLVRTVLTHRRWLRTFRVQSEVHTKLLDRFAGTNELLAYIQTSPGRRFLEAAPIPVEGTPDRPISAPLNRILWSAQAGIVLVVGGFGLQYVSGSVVPDVGQGLWVIGVVGTAFGLGFILAGALAFVMSRRFGLLQPPALPVGERGDSPVA